MILYCYCCKLFSCSSILVHMSICNHRIQTWESYTLINFIFLISCSCKCICNISTISHLFDSTCKNNIACT